jgi:DHA2 family multidrug resistance protein
MTSDRPRGAEGGYPPLTGMSLILAATALSMGNFMVVLDTTIANVAMPTISGDVGVSTTEGTWIITAYAVAEAITVPLTGWLARQMGEVRLFIVCTIAFVIFSVACGLSGSLGLLVLFRILQGFAGGPLIPLSSTLLISIFPKSRANIALSIWGLMTVVAPIFGPIIGGYISDNFHWGWIFYINIFFGAFVGVTAWILLRNRETPIQRSRIDVVGLGLLVVFVTAFQVMIDKGASSTGSRPT